jgi:cell division septation protein DedD
MTDREIQKDFFDGRKYEEKARKPLLIRRYPDRIFLPQLKIPVEYAVIISIAVLVLVIIAYAAGVERGKRVVSPVETENYRAETVVAETAGDTTETTEQVIVAVQQAEVAEPEEPEPAPVVKQPVREPVEEPERPVGKYVIQLASFKNRDSAEEEVAKLENSGIHVDVSKKGDWYQVYAYGYATIESARKAKKLLSADYKDCYIRRLK